MQNKMDLGSTRVVKLGRYTVGIRLPEEWCAHNKINIGDTLYIRGEMDKSITIYPKPEQWAIELKLRVKDRKYPIVTIPQDLTKTREIDSGDYVSRIIDTRDGSLRIKKLRIPDEAES